MNISFRSSRADERVLSNLAPTPFALDVDGEHIECASVEGFWQGLKHESPMREHVFQLSGFEAKRAGAGKGQRHFELAGREYQVGSPEHRELIEEAVRQKILQHTPAREALAASRGPITHQVSGHQARATFDVAAIVTKIRLELFGY